MRSDKVKGWNKIDSSQKALMDDGVTVSETDISASILTLPHLIISFDSEDISAFSGG